MAAIAGYVHGSGEETYVVAAMVNAADAHCGTGEEFLDELVKWAFELP